MLRRGFFDFVTFSPSDGAGAGADTGGAAPAGSVAPPSGDTGGAGNGGSATQGSSASVDNGWLAALDENTRKTAEAKGWKSPADPIKSYSELFADYTKKTSNAIALPGPDAPPEAWNEVYTKLGRPETPEGYEYQLPESVPKDLPYDQNLALSSKQWAHEAGLTPKQAQVLHDKFAGHQAQAYMQFQEQQENRVEAAHQALTKAWGPEGSVEYKRNQELANRALRHQGGEELIGELKAIGALDANGRVMAPKLAMTLAKIGETLYAEDAVYAGPGGMENPFAEKTENLTQQGKLIRENPQLAKALMRQAGLDPAIYRMK